MRRISMLFGLMATAALAVTACESSPDPVNKPGEPGDPGEHPFLPQPENPEASRPSVTHTVLDDRVVDYNAALRTASLKLVRALPTLEQIKRVQNAPDPARAYDDEIDAMLEDPRFTTRMIKFWRDAMRMAGGAADGMPSRNTAPNLAARITVEGRPFTELFTSTSNNCPEYNGDTSTWTDGECQSGAPVEAGVLTNPGVQHQFYGSMAFRRVRWVQEVFVCTKFPAEYTEKPTQVNGADYVSPWPFEAVSDAPINFQDASSVVCANCHSTINRIAPLFANFDANGMWQPNIAVMTPLVEPIPSAMDHWLKGNEGTAWRFGEPVKDLAELGQAMAADPDVSECVVTRLYNLAMSKEDVVDSLATVPYEVLDEYMLTYFQTGANLKATLKAIFTSADFVRF
jgi:hypothetical protein